MRKIALSALILAVLGVVSSPGAAGAETSTVTFSPPYSSSETNAWCSPEPCVARPAADPLSGVVSISGAAQHSNASALVITRHVLIEERVSRIIYKATLRGWRAWRSTAYVGGQISLRHTGCGSCTYSFQDWPLAGGFVPQGTVTIQAQIARTDGGFIPPGEILIMVGLRGWTTTVMGSLGQFHGSAAVTEITAVIETAPADPVPPPCQKPPKNPHC
jgi:hypothetical protein